MIQCLGRKIVVAGPGIMIVSPTFGAKTDRQKLTKPRKSSDQRLLREYIWQGYTDLENVTILGLRSCLRDKMRVHAKRLKLPPDINPGVMS